VPVRIINHRNLKTACRELAGRDEALGSIFDTYGTPPLWDRPRGFATLIHIVLEQQVSLASAKACFDKLTALVGEVTPSAILTLNDAEMKVIGFSRQKSAYARHLSEAHLNGGLDFDQLHKLPDQEAKLQLMNLKGVGHWTADIYLLMAMLRPDIMPRGDLALHIAWQKLTNAENRPGSEEFVSLAERWRPFRSVAARMLWHFYLSDRQTKRSTTARVI